MIRPENFRAENFLCRIFLGAKILRSDFFGREKFKVRFFLDAKFFCPEIFVFEFFFQIVSCIERKRKENNLRIYFTFLTSSLAYT